MSDDCVSLEKVVVARGGQKVLEVPSFSAPASRVTVLVGENGAGKSTLLLAAAGLLDMAAGRVRLFGQDFHRGRAPAPKHMRRQTAFVFQEPYLFARSVRSNLTFGLRIRGVGKEKRREAASKVLEKLGISDLARRPAAELSGGESKLVALGRALVLEPRLLFLDEVTASLDDDARDKVLGMIKKLVEKGTSVMMATHLEGLAEKLGAGSFVMQGGRVL